MAPLHTITTSNKIATEYHSLVRRIFNKTNMSHTKFITEQTTRTGSTASTQMIGPPSKPSFPNGAHIREVKYRYMESPMAFATIQYLDWYIFNLNATKVKVIFIDTDSWYTYFR